MSGEIISRARYLDIPVSPQDERAPGKPRSSLWLRRNASNSFPKTRPNASLRKAGQGLQASQSQATINFEDLPGHV